MHTRVKLSKFAESLALQAGAADGDCYFSLVDILLVSCFGIFRVTLYVLDIVEKQFIRL